MKMKERMEKESTYDKKLACVKIRCQVLSVKSICLIPGDKDCTDVGRAQRGYSFPNGHTAGHYHQDLRLLSSPSKVHVVYQESTQKITKSVHQLNKTNAVQEGI